MKPTKGLSLDTTPENQPEGTYPFGKNGIQHNLDGSVINEPGFTPFSITPAGYLVIGVLEADDSSVFVFYTNNVYSGIKHYDVKNDLVLDNFTDQSLPYKLGFNSEYYITGEVQRNNKGELVVYFTDKNTVPKYWNPTKDLPLSLKGWKIFPEYSESLITKTLTSGGAMEVGAYYCALRYSKTDGTVTSFTPVTGSIIAASNDGTDVSDKSLTLTISGQDTDYEYFEIALIKKTKTGTSAVLLEKKPVSLGSTTITYTGDGIYEAISLEEILVPQIRYSKVGCMGQLNDALYIANLEKEPDIVDMQRYANMVKLEWVSNLVDVLSLPDEVVQGKKKGFMHEEVYAFYIRYKLASGSYTVAHHIPGVAGLAAHLLPSSIGTTGGLVNALVYEVEDTITDFSASNFAGVPGTYRNKTELYPDNPNFDSSGIGGEDLRNQPVRHHKMPSLRWCKQNLYAAEAAYGKSKLDLLGIRATNIIIPPEHADTIVGYEILYAKRTIDNMTVYGQSLVLYSANESTGATITNSTLLYSTGDNWNVNVTGQGFQLDKTNFRFHSFDLLLNRPGIQPSHLSHQYRLDTKTKIMYKQWAFPTSGSITDGKGISIFLNDRTSSAASVSTNPSGNYVNAIDKGKYVKNHSTVGDNINTYLETAYTGKLLGPQQQITFSGDIFPETTDPSYMGIAIQAYLANLSDIKSDVYNSLYSQTLISAGDAVNLNTIQTFWGGDIFPSLYTFHTYGHMDRQWDVPYTGGSGEFAYPENRTRRVVHRFICETIANHSARYEITGNIYSKWFDHSTLLPYAGAFGTLYPAEYNSTVDPNQFGYTKGFEGINDFISGLIYSPYREYLYKFPYRVHRGGKLSRTSTRNWNTFLALDYYETQKNMGHIVNITGMQDRLLIHHENALFMTQDKAKLDSGLLSVTLGSGDLFQFEPQEVQASKLGFGGTQHDLACIKSPLGYLFTDSKQGDVFLYNNKELQSLSPGLVQFLQEYLVVRGKNPFQGNGITMGWDREYKRILLTVKHIRPAGFETIQEIDLFEPDRRLEIDGNEYLIISKGASTLTFAPGSVVSINGRYLTYMGLNNMSMTNTSCPPDEVKCSPIVSLTINKLSGTSAQFSWSGTPVTWELLKEDSGGYWSTAQSGSTASTTVTLTGLTAGTIYKFVVTHNCSPLLSTPTALVFSLAATVTPPVDPCAPSGGTFATTLQTWNVPNPYPSNISGLILRVKANNGSWQAWDTYGSNPSRTLENPSFNACLKVEFGINASISGGAYTNYHPTDALFPGFQYAIQNVICTCVDRNTPPVVSASPNMPTIFTNPAFANYNYFIQMIPDPTTAYTAPDRYGNICTGYWSWYIVQKAWLGGATTVADPLLGTVGPMTNFKVNIWEGY